MPHDPSTYLFLLAGAREGGNTETLARAAAAELPAHAAQTWLDLRELPLAPFADIRHAGDGVYPQPEGAEKILLDATLAADHLVIASPLYWYSVSASAKLYLDYWSGWLRVPGADFKARMRGKTLSAVTTISSTDRTTADPLLGTLRLSARYLGMHWGGALIGYGNRPGDISADAEALTRAKTFLA
ncbi:NAD(P)H-dependent oxidoreductase [Catellatospora vulcania]|uniref:NAD(P)H-dependent oxidoreductase n=1 Tax=Catellatospora vulcania TaxID=1460450 RepID=UPI001E61A044|nr:NAD(P)H-dependent oxidoreductase [Catellatospora vulcania]